MTEILQMLKALGCTSAVFAEPDGAHVCRQVPVFPCGSGLRRETERCGEPGGRV